MGVEVAAAAPRLGAVASAAGDSASPAAMMRLKDAVTDLKQKALRPALEQAVEAIRREDYAAGGEWAIKALNVDERSGLGWWMLAISREKAGDLRTAISCYESALALLPNQGELANDLGRLAYSLGQKDVAEKLFSVFLLSNPGHPEAANNLACALRDQQRFAEAIEVLRTVIYAHPETAMLWNTLGTVMNEQGDVAESQTFYDEALRLEPRFARARYNRGNARLSTGDLQGALEDVEAALNDNQSPADEPMIRLARATARIAGGDLARGWDDYEIRLDPRFPDTTRFLVDGPRWTPETEVLGKTVLVIGEQGLGDEILFANVLPDLIQAIGPLGKLMLAVEPRQVKLFQQSFPQAFVGAHQTFRVDNQIVRALPFLAEAGPFDCWTPMGSLNRRFRREVEAFPNTPAFLKADPARVTHWREQLSALGAPTVGVLWKSLKIDSARRRFFSPFEQWRAVLKTPGVAFVNLQYGDCSAELEQAKAAGIDIWNPPGIDLKDDLDDLAALCCALDLVIGPANATTNIAAACGARVWLISTPGAWPRLGTDRYPWYPTVEVFDPPALNQWAAVMDEIAGALSKAF
ncbi:MAG: tetratricopeptide repeat protein [Proteobacteria bacterium]|nr:tetratricopeptide repeat protein [Pseudomonadota bacterium]